MIQRLSGVSKMVIPFEIVSPLTQSERLKYIFNNFHYKANSLHLQQIFIYRPFDCGIYCVCSFDRMRDAYMGLIAVIGSFDKSRGFKIKYFRKNIATLYIQSEIENSHRNTDTMTHETEVSVKYVFELTAKNREHKITCNHPAKPK